MTGKPGVLQSMRSQNIKHDLATEQQQHIHICHIPAALNFVKIAYFLISRIFYPQFLLYGIDMQKTCPRSGRWPGGVTPRPR